MKLKILFLTFLFLITLAAHSQVVLWGENFDELSNGLMLDQGTSAWSAQKGNCPEKKETYFAVQYGKFAATQLACEAIFETQSIDISGKGLVRLQLQLTATPNLNALDDYLRFEYQVDQGAWQLVSEVKGNPILKNDMLKSPSFTGKSVSMRISVKIKGNEDFYYFDNLRVMSVGSEASAYNRTTVRAPQVKIKDKATLLAASSDSVLKQTTYFDGLGREKQSVSYQTSPEGKDVVSFREYNAQGKEPLSYLPFVNGKDGTFKASAKDLQAKFYISTPQVAENTHPYAEILQENSPFGRVLEQGSIGEAWQIQKDEQGNSTQKGKTSKYAYRTNDEGELLRYFYNEEKKALWFEEGNYYAPATLSVQEMKNAEGYRMRSYANSLGQTVALAQEKALDAFIYTYYFYDEVGNLLLMLPPAAMAAAKAQGLTELTSDFLDKWCFQYYYDEKGKFLLAQKSPGAGWSKGVYDKWGRLLLSQDARQAIQNMYVFYQYDTFGRVVLEGNYESKETPEEIHAQAQNLTSLKDAGDLTDLATPHGYSKGHFPLANTPFTEQNTQVIYFYDDYAFLDLFLKQTEKDLKYQQVLDNPPAKPKALGELTGRKIKIGNTEKYLYEVYYYDKDGNLLQLIYTDHLGGVHRISSQYDFTGKTLQTLHHYEGLESYQLLERYKYDPKGRLLATYHKINEEAEQELSSYTYNAVGQVTTKTLGKNLQTLRYDYHLKGWLNGLNKNMQPTDLFKLNLKYETPGLEGNLSEQWWISKLDNIPRGYSYTYDPMQRLESATYAHKNEATNEKFSLPKISYDDNGNILGLAREGLLTHEKGEKATFGLVDELSYSYEGNQLKVVEDKIATQNMAGDFENKNLQENNPVAEYNYDPNGNLVEDKNKGIISIVYNELNLPTTIYFDKEGENRIDYLYDAAGNKLQKTVYQEGKASTTDYLYLFVYEDQDLAFINTSEGRVLSPKAMQSETHGYEYHIRDHLGSLRVAFRKGNTYAYLATMEEANAQTEELLFDNVKDTRDKNYACTGASASKLSQKQMMGPWKSVYVSKGDSIKIEVKALYVEEDKNKNGLSLLAYLNNLNDFTPSKESGNSLPLLQLGLGYIPQPQKKEAIPTAYLRYILYDKDSNYVQSELMQVTSAAFKSCENLHLALQVPIDGYMQIFVANESETATYFDDLEIKLSESLIAQEMHYDPWGLPLKGIERTNLHASKFTYMDVEQETSFNLNWSETAFRSYDAQLGRFHGIDLLADNYESFSPYHYGFNNPISFSDPLGLAPTEGPGAAGMAPGEPANPSISTNPFEDPGYQFGNVLDQLGNTGGGDDPPKTGGTSAPNKLEGRLFQGFNMGWQSTVDHVKYQFTMEGLANRVANLATGNMLSSWDMVEGLVTTAQDLPNYKTGDYVQGAGFMGYKILEFVALRKASITIAPKIPLRLPSRPIQVTKGSNINMAKVMAGNMGNKKVSPNIQKILNYLDEIKSEGGMIKINPLNPTQELNMTIQKGTRKLDLRIETHTVPQKYNGNGLTPQRHLNVDLYPNKKVLPNSGHKILE